MAVFLSTQVFDSALGQAAEGLALAVYRVDASDEGPQLLNSTVINTRGGTDEPLLKGEQLENFHLPIHCSPYAYSVQRGC